MTPKTFVGSIAAACACAAVLLSSGETRAEDFGNIMPMGDSITLGVGSSPGGGYRDPLYRLLTARGDTFTFVGNQTGSDTETLRQAGQQHHQGCSGFVISNCTVSATATSARNGLHENLEEWIGPGKAAPDVILLMIGTNDIDQNHEIENAPNRLRSFITSIYDYRPNVKLFLATVVPMKNVRNPGVTAFNAAFPQIVAEQRALGHDVRLVPMADALDINTDFNDTLHPNNSGYLKMAQTWDRALHAQREAVAITDAGNGKVGDFRVGWDFTVTNSIVVKALGQFDPNNHPGSNKVALYRRNGNKLAEVTVGADVAGIPGGVKNVRYVTIPDLLLTSNDYVIVSQQGNGVYFLEDCTVTAGEGIIWNKGVAISGKSNDLPDIAPEKWPIENPNGFRYLGPTFQYEFASKSDEVKLLDMPIGQHALNLTGWNEDMIIGADEPAPGYTKGFCGWSFYEYGLPGTTQGLASSADPTNRTFKSAFKDAAYKPVVQFTFQPYDENNVLFIEEVNSEATLELVNPARYHSLQFLMTSRTATWFARLNFSDGTSVETPVYKDIDWVDNSLSDKALTKYGLKGVSGNFYTNAIWMADRRFVLSETDRTKTLASITFKLVGGSNHQLCVLAVSGYGLGDKDGKEPMCAQELIGSEQLPEGKDSSVVGYDFNVLFPITVTHLGQFSYNNGAVGNSVAIYKINGNKLSQVQLTDNCFEERCGNDIARFRKIPNLCLEAGDYRIASTQKNNPYRAMSGIVTANQGAGITWLQGIANSVTTNPTLPENGGLTSAWEIQNNVDPNFYLGPTFKYVFGKHYSNSTIILVK